MDNKVFYSKIFELFHTVLSLYGDLSYIMLSTHDHVLRFLSIYFQTNLLTSDYFIWNWKYKVNKKELPTLNVKIFWQ